MKGDGGVWCVSFGVAVGSRWIFWPVVVVVVVVGMGVSFCMVGEGAEVMGFDGFEVGWCWGRVSKLRSGSRCDFSVMRSIVVYRRDKKSLGEVGVRNEGRYRRLRKFVGNQ